MSVQEFIRAVAEEKDGFILDEPWRVNESSLGVVVPVKRDSKETREYITFAEAQKVKVEDTGQIDYVFVRNDEDKPLLISRGEIFRGKTQERAAIHGYVIMPGTGVRVAVRCIHQSRGIKPGTEMKYGGKVPNFIDLSDQRRTWNTVRAYAGSYSSTYCSTVQDTGSAEDIQNVLLFGSLGHDVNIPASDDLVNSLDDISKNIREAMKKIPPIENQVGAIFIHENDFQGMDIYDLPDSWKFVKEDIISKEGSSYIKKDEINLFEFKPEKVKALIGKSLSVTFEEKIIYGDQQGQSYKIIEIREVVDTNKKKRIVGEAVEFNGKVINLTLYTI